MGRKSPHFHMSREASKRCIQEAQKLAKRINGFLANQFANQDNLLAQYETTGQEIVNPSARRYWWICIRSEELVELSWE